MSANVDALQGQHPLPGNTEYTEKFPQFCLRDHDASSLSNRSSTYSQASTTSTSPTDYSSTEQDGASPASASPRPRTLSGSPPRSRRDKKELHAARLQRSGSSSLSLGKKEAGANTKTKRFHRGSDPAAALAAVEPPHDQGLTRMAFAEQQRWITVQQKTFTKWYRLS
jgi:hypothetical protein